jgi:hypothetical protein
MSEQDLIPFPLMAPEQHKELAIKGGRAESPLKKLAAKLRELKKKGLTEDNAKRLMELMTEPDITDLDILMLIQAMQAQAKTLKEKQEGMKLYIEWRKLHHGTKERVEQRLDVNIKNYKFIIDMKNIPHWTTSNK